MSDLKNHALPAWPKNAWLKKGGGAYFSRKKIICPWHIMEMGVVCMIPWSKTLGRGGCTVFPPGKKQTALTADNCFYGVSVLYGLCVGSLTDNLHQTLTTSRAPFAKLVQEKG